MGDKLWQNFLCHHCCTFTTVVAKRDLKFEISAFQMCYLWSENWCRRDYSRSDVSIMSLSKSFS